MDAFLKAEDYKNWLLKPNDSSAIDEESGDKWNHEKDETLYFIPVLLTVALYVALVVVFYIASLRARWKTRLSSSLLTKIKRVAQLQQEAETIGSSKTIEQEESAVEKNLQSTVVRSDNKENVTAGGKHLPPPSLEPSAIPSSQAASRIHKHMSEVEPEGERKENVISSGSSSLPTSSERMASQLPSHTVSHFSSNKSKDFSCKPISASINEQVDLESVSKGSASSPLVSAATYGTEAKIPTLKPKPQEPMAAAEGTDTSPHSTVNAVVETKVKPGS
ncbi:hypothetical protein D918_02447 [Trichuris suis]|nr:hypothetical protein D918_02447 [Trichuris suis]